MTPHHQPKVGEKRGIALGLRSLPQGLPFQPGAVVGGWMSVKVPWQRPWALGDNVSQVVDKRCHKYGHPWRWQYLDRDAGKQWELLCHSDASKNVETHSLSFT